METQSQPDPPNATQTHGVDVASLEKQLAAMWRETAKAEPGVTRVCLANLVVYAPDEASRAGLGELLEEIAEHTPSRVVILHADRESEFRLDAHVSSRCRESEKGRRQVCCEQVTLEAGGAALASLASAVEPLLLSDVPTFLWWKDIPHYEDKLFARLVEMSDRVLIDSAAFDHPHADLTRVARLINERADVTRLSDLNWGRLTAWRSLVAGFWDVPEYRAHLDALDSVRLEFSPPALAPEEFACQALLVAGWLASRLGWKVSGGKPARSGDTLRVALDAGGRAIELELRAAGVSHEGNLRRVTLRDAKGAAEFYAVADESGARLETCARIGAARRVGRVLAYEAKTEGQRLSRELSILARDEVYEQAVASAAALIAPLVAAGWGEIPVE
ncbi:MAG: glucose-6-phosphate dehydrogenase assembly protein OpcA [Pyrinomonadaceae bacterium]